MSNTKTWIIADINSAPTEDGLEKVAKVIHWRKQATETVDGKAYIADIYGSCAVSAPDPETFLPYESLTEAIVIPWLEATLDVDSIDTNLDAQIEQQKNPPIVSYPLPWAVVPEAPVEETLTPSQEAAQNIAE